MNHDFLCIILLVSILLIGCTNQIKDIPDSKNKLNTQWSAYGGDGKGNRYVAHDQINHDNVAKLEISWTARTGEVGQNSRIKEKLTFEATPIYFQDQLILSTAYGKVLSLHPSTGNAIWIYDPKIDRASSFSELTSRGVSSWVNEGLDDGDACKYCIVYGTIDAKLIKLDALTGMPCKKWGSHGQINLHAGINVPEPGDHQITSPPAIINDLAIVGSSIGDNFQSDTGSGVVRAYNLISGELVWSWNPLLAERENFTGPVGAANAWSVMSVDKERDLVFIPTGSASPDFYGVNRPGNNQYANSIVCLKASNGKMKWHFQTVHHDLWDYDVAAQPALVDINKDGKEIPAVLQATKTGNLFLLHRETGAPIYPIEERVVPASDIVGEVASATQPFSSLPNIMHTDSLKYDMDKVKELLTNGMDFIKIRNEGIYTPPSLHGSIMYPGNGSGVNWGSVSFDHHSQLLITNTSRFATFVQLFPRDEYDSKEKMSRGFELSGQRGTPYGMRRTTMTYRDGTLLNPPPYGTLVAVNLSTGNVAWEKTLGKSEASPFGLTNSGGSIITQGGLIFIASTPDNMFRAFRLSDGELLWETKLPRAGIATPMSYIDENGKQFVVIAAGGHGKQGLPTSDFVVAFALPN